MVVKAIRFDFSKLKYDRRRRFFDTDAKFALRVPALYKEKRIFGERFANIMELGNSVGLNKDDQIKLLTIHYDRLRKYTTVSLIVSTLFYLLFALIGLILIAVLLSLMGLTPPGSLPYTNNVTPTVLYILFFVTVIFALQIADRITSVILDRQYADTLAFVTCLNLIVQLAQSESFLHVKDHLITIRRVRGLRNQIILLSYQYSGANPTMNDWIRNRFSRMEQFVELVEQQIVMSSSKTQENLLRALMPFLKVLLTRQYGEFAHKDNVSKLDKNMQNQSSPTRGRLLKFLGVASPILLLVANYLFRDLFQIVGLENQLVALVGFSWFLLALDANLNLGIVDRISSLAKAIRELR